MGNGDFTLLHVVPNNTFAGDKITVMRGLLWLLVCLLPHCLRLGKRKYKSFSQINRLKKRIDEKRDGFVD